jgi:hypothetical protein
MKDSVGQIGQGMVNQVNSLKNQVSQNLARSAGLSFGNIAAGGMYGVGQGLGGLAAGLQNGAGMRVAGTDQSSSSSSNSGSGSSEEEGGSSASRGLKQASMFMTNPEITSFGIGAINAAGGNNFPADLGLSGFGGDFGGGLGGLGGFGGGLGGLGGGLGGLGGGLNALGVGGGLGGLGNNPLAALGGLAGGGSGLGGGDGLGGALAGGLGRSPAGGVGGLLGALFNNKKGAQTPASSSGSSNAGGFSNPFSSGHLPSSSSSSGSGGGSYNPYGALAGLEQGTLGSGISASMPAAGLPGTAAAAAGGAAAMQQGAFNPYASVNYEQNMGQLAQIPGQAIGAMAGYGTGIAQQGQQTIQNAGSNMVQQGLTSLQTPGQPVLGGNQQPTVVQGLGQDPNTYLLGGSDYYPGGSNAFGQAGGRGATYTAGQGGLTGGALTPSTTIGGQFAGGQLGSGGGFIGQNPNPGGTFDPSTGERCAGRCYRCFKLY